MLFLLLVACGVMPYHRPPVPVPVPPTPEGAPPIAAIGPALAHLDKLLGTTEDVDRRDRLVELRDLLVGVQLADPKVQERVVRYAERVLAVEDRSQPFGFAESPMEMATTLDAVVEEAVPEPPKPVDVAARQLAEGHPMAAIATLDAAVGAPAGAAELRKRAVNAWATAERERVGAAFVAALAMEKGPARAAAILAVRDSLAAINARFPDNAVADDVRKHLETVEKELAAP